MSRKSVFVYLCILSFSSPLFAQVEAEKFRIGKKEMIRSEILNEDRNAHIFLPDGYSRSTENYPVLYILYSEAADFHFSTGVVAGLSRLRLIPRMITVAVNVGDGMRDLTPTKSPDYGPTSGGAEHYLQFIKEELIPFIDKNYRTAPQRLYWSHSIGGLFGLYALLKDPDVFQSVLVSSPYFVYDRGERYIIKNTRNFLQHRKGQNNYLYICVGNEPRLVSEIEDFLKILEEVKPEGLMWDSMKLPEEDHMSILARSLTEGLRAFGSN